MMNNLRKILSIVCIAAMLFTLLIPVSAETRPTFALSQTNLTQGTGSENVDITLTLSNNIGLAGVQFNLSYTEGLTLNRVTKGTALSTLTYTPPGDLSANPAVLVWAGEVADSTNGVILTLNFTVPKTTVKDYNITITPVAHGIYDNNLDDVTVDVVNGKIAVTEKPKENFTGLSVSNASFEYDGTAKSLTVNGVPSGASVVYSCDDFDEDGKAIDAGTYNVTATVKKDGYNDWTGNATLTISKKELTVTGLSAESKTYDGTDAAVLSGGTLTGKVGTDDVSADIPKVGKFTSVNAGNNIGVSIAPITLSGTKKDNYTLVQPEGLKANIEKVAITVTAEGKTKKVSADDPALTYTYDKSKLVGEDAFTGSLTREEGETVGDYKILVGSLKLTDNYDMTFVGATFKIVDKTPQTITVADFEAKTYGEGEQTFTIAVTPDATSGLKSYGFASDNEAVATVSAAGLVTIVGAGTAKITVTEPGNNEYAAAEPVIKTLTVAKKAVSVKSVDLSAKTAVIEGILEADKEAVALDFDKIKTTVISSTKSTVDEITTVTSSVKVEALKLKGAKAANYAITEASVNTSVSAVTVSEKLTQDENVTIEAAPVDDNTIIITDLTASGEGESITVDVTEIANTKVNTVAIPKTVVDTIAASGKALEITVKDGNNNDTTVVLNSEALSEIATAAGSATTLSVSVAKTAEDELTDEQASKLDEVAEKSPVVYSISFVSENGTSVATTFGENGAATVTLSYEKPEGNGTIVVVFLDKSGNTTVIPDPVYDEVNKTVTITLGHFSEYMIYTEPARYTGGGGGGRGTTSFTLRFITMGGSAVESIEVDKNEIATAPKAPVREGYDFAGRYIDKELKNKYEFTEKVTKNLTLYAAWTENGEAKKDDAKKDEDKPQTPVTDDKKEGFTDVKEDDWFFANVKYVAENGLMNGTSESEFAPQNSLTRAMLVTILYRAAGQPAVNKSVPFADVKADMYYANAVIWAQQNGIVSGVTENEFAPDMNITREQIAAIIYRYAKAMGYDVSVGADTNILSYTDAEEISEYAIEAMCYAVGSGLMKGKTESTLNPLDNATRAEIAAILQKFIEANK